MVIKDQIAKLRACVRPLLIDSGVAEAPVGVWGTFFTAAHGPALFAVTAAHLVRGNHSGELRLLLSDRSTQRLPLSTGIGVLADEPGDEVDLLVYPASLLGLTSKEMRRARILNLTPEVTSWRPGAHTAQMLLVGYPREHSEVDYDAGRVMAGQVMLTGSYLGPAEGSRYLHRLSVANVLSLKEFAGFSGGPVFSAEHQVGADPVFRFCGVAVAGTAFSEVMHFVEAERVLELMHTAIGHVRQFGMQLAEPVKGVTPSRRTRNRRGRRV